MSDPVDCSLKLATVKRSFGGVVYDRVAAFLNAPRPKNKCCNSQAIINNVIEPVPLGQPVPTLNALPADSPEPVSEESVVGFASVEEETPAAEEETPNVESTKESVSPLLPADTAGSEKNESGMAPNPEASPEVSQ